jgi:hypothetical protein
MSHATAGSKIPRRRHQECLRFSYLSSRKEVVHSIAQRSEHIKRLPSRGEREREKRSCSCELDVREDGVDESQR